VAFKTGVVRLYLDSIAYVDSLLLFPFVDTAVLTEMRLYMTDSVAVHAADISDLWEEYVGDRETGLANAYSDLENMTVATEFDEVNQDIGVLRLKLLLGGVEILSGSEWDTIAVKAGECTLLDGDGVLEARGLLLLVSDTIIVDGIQCVPIEERSPGHISIDSNIDASLLIEVIPNPATRGWSIVNKNEKILTYTLYASNGAAMSTGAIDQNATWISAQELINGLYFLHVLNEHGVSQIEKLQLVAE
jgi:hypothetical protein